MKNAIKSVIKLMHFSRKVKGI